MKTLMTFLLFSAALFAQPIWPYSQGAYTWIVSLGINYAETCDPGGAPFPWSSPLPCPSGTTRQAVLGLGATNVPYGPLGNSGPYGDFEGEFWFFLDPVRPYSYFDIGVPRLYTTNTGIDYELAHGLCFPLPPTPPPGPRYYEAGGPWSPGNVSFIPNAAMVTPIPTSHGGVRIQVAWQSWTSQASAISIPLAAVELPVSLPPLATILHDYMNVWMVGNINHQRDGTGWVIFGTSGQP